MKIIKKENILDRKIQVEMTVADFLSIYISRMVAMPLDFYQCGEDFFEDFTEDDVKELLFLNALDTEEMETLIDELGIPHKDWL